MMMPRSCLLALPLLASTVACDLALLPETADYRGGVDAPRVAVEIGASIPNTMDERVDRLHVVVDGVMLHRPADDTWILLSQQAQRVDLSVGETPVILAPVAVADESYDALAFVIESAQVEIDGHWRAIGLVADDVELPFDLDVDGDLTVGLHFDLGDALEASAADSFAFEPRSAFATRQ